MKTARYLSCESIIYKVLTDYGIETTDWINDAAQWCAEALDAVNSPITKVLKNVELSVINNTTSLPEDYIEIINIVYNDKIMNRVNNPTNDSQYRFDPPFLNFSFATGSVYMNYKGYPVENGFPMYPDDFSTREALSWYIIYKLTARGTKFPNSEINFRLAYQMWLKYCAQAYNRHSMPDRNEMIIAMNKWSDYRNICGESGVIKINPVSGFTYASDAIIK